MKSTRTLLLAAVTQLAVLACSESTTGPGDTAALSHEISSDELAQALDTAPARVEVKLQPGTLVAREVELKTADEMTDEESVRGPVTAVSSSGDAGTITFAIGELVVSFTSDARFRNAGGDSVSMEDFVALVQDGLDAGTQPSVRAKRPPLAEPQAPGDATFEATDLRLRSAAEEPELELNVDADNYEVNDTPPPDAWLRVLGLEIEVVASTEIEADDDHRDEVEVEGMVASVDVAGGSVMLEDGTVILASAASFEHEDDDDEHLASLEAVADALNAGQTVKAEAEGAVESTDPLTIRAHEIEFEVRNGDGDDEDDDGDDDGTQGQVVEFERAVQSVDVGAASFTLSDGSIVLVSDTTQVDAEGDLLTLQAVADALAAEKPVKAEGRARVESAGPPVSLAALTVKWEVDD